MSRPEEELYKKAGLAASFSCALRGVGHALATERNLRIHLACAVYVLYFSRYYSLSRGEYGLLVLLLGLVLCCELLNTAIERTVDLKTPAYNPLAGQAKDVAAGAVLVSGFISVAIGFLLFWNPPVLLLIGLDILRRWWLWLLLLSATFLWVFLPCRLQKRS